MSIEPCYDFSQLNEDSILAQTRASVTVHGKPYEIDVEVRLRLLPSPAFEIEGVLPESAGILEFESVESVTIAGKDVPGSLKEIPFPLPGIESRFIWGLKLQPFVACGSAQTEMVRVVFHIFNYKDFVGTRASIESTSAALHRIGHIDLKAAGWSVELKSLLATRDTCKTLQKKGGYGLTHLGLLQKEDGSAFDGKTAEQSLNALRHFLSFSKGTWCNPCLAVGFDNKEDKVWEAWSSPGRHWASATSWFDPDHCDELVGLFPGFMSKWGDENWRKALHDVIYWYLASNSPTPGVGINIDAGIILTQTGIERLSFEYVVRKRRLIEAEGFKNLRASDRFRILFSSLNIPIGIPPCLPEFQKLAGEFNWIDAPHAITEIRNSIVHPEHKRKGRFGKAFYPAWNLGQWYLELALLRICDYSGTYSNRLVSNKYVGTVEHVPWIDTKGD